MKIKTVLILAAVLTLTLPSCNTLQGLLAGNSAAATSTTAGVTRPTTEMDLMRLQILDRMSARIQNRAQGGAQ